MDYGDLGQTGLRVSRIGLGLAALGRPGYINLGHAADLRRKYDVAVMEKRTHKLLKIAFREGVRYFDAARSYGRAEAFLASWLEDYDFGPGDTTIGSKWGYTYTADWRVEAEAHEVKDHSLATLTRQRAQSDDLLGTHLDLYQVHSATFSSGILDNREVHEQLAAYQHDSLVIGLSLSGPDQADVLRRAMEIEVNGRRLFQTVQATWNLLERSAEPSLREAHEAGMGVIVKEALANGRLTPRNDDPAFADQRALLDRLAADQGVGIDALALAGVLLRDWCDVVLSGAATVPHLNSNLESLYVDWDDEIEDALTALTESPEAYWRTRSQLPWN